jgi:hypothetical protein
MSNYTPHQVYERVPLRGTKPESVIFTGRFAAPSGNDSNVLVELQITAPPEAVTTVTAFTSAVAVVGDPFAGLLEFSVPAWRSDLCGRTIEYQVRGLDIGSYTDWETSGAVITPRRDDHPQRTWVRKVDGDIHVPPGPKYQPTTRWYPATLDELIWCVRNQYDTAGPAAQSHACGSHWAMSYASVTGGQMFETATPVHEAGGDQLAGRLNNVLYDVVPDCLSAEALRFFQGQDVPTFNDGVLVDETKNYLFHVEAGARIHEIYAYIDDYGEAQGEAKSGSLARVVTDLNAVAPPTSNRPNYFGPWAFETLGGAGGQTIVGVASTATHGGDVESSAVGEMILALHLIAPDGQEYWIERTQLRPSTIPIHLVDPDKLQRKYAVGDPNAPGGTQRRRPIIYKRDNDLMDAVLVSCGRMGVIYSVVLRTIRQYGLNQVTKEDSWAETKKWIADKTTLAYQQMFINRFVRIDVDLYPKPDFDWHDAAFTFALLALAGPIGLAAGVIVGLKGHEYRAWHLTRIKARLKDTIHTDSSGNPYYYGRPQRGGAAAGQNPPLDVDDSKSWVPTFTNPCRSSNFLRQFLTDMIGHLSDIRDDAIEAAAAAGAAMVLFPPAAAWAIPLQAVMAGVIVFTEYWIVILSGLRAILPDEAPFGDFLCAVMNALGELHAGSILQLMYWAAQNSQHLSTSKPLVAISYGVMDEHDYQNKGCVAPGDSIELFFDSADPGFVSFVDYVIDQVRDLEDDGKVWAGYLSLRFMAQSPAHLAMQRWPRTVSMEIASLSKVNGADELMSRIEEESRRRGVILHWGQRNNRLQRDIEPKFAFPPWRKALSDFTEHGRLANFSTEYTQLKGLEITEPWLYGFSADKTEGCSDENTVIHYDGFNNPPETKLAIVQRFANGTSSSITLADLRGTIALPFGQGQSILELHALRVLNGNKYEAAPLSLELRGFATGDYWEFRFEAEERFIAGANRWFAELNLFSSFISDKLKVSEVGLSASSGNGWIIHKPPLADINFAGTADTQPIPGDPIFNTNWQFYSAAPAGGGTPPQLTLRFKMIC